MNRSKRFKSSMSACVVYGPYYSDYHIGYNDELDRNH